jgi:PEGA domain-containing protein
VAHRTPLVLALAAGIALGAAGCMKRSLVIRTDPVGAVVFVNGRNLGPSPVTVPYVHEGRFDVRVELPGYESVALEMVTPTRANAVPGPDFFAEHLSRRNRQTVHDVRLSPLKTDSYTRAELEEMWKRAEAFRARANEPYPAAGAPAPPAPTTPSPSADR